MQSNRNCPNCGAPITSYKCEYCGTVFSSGYVVQDIKATMKLDELLEKGYINVRTYLERDLLITEVKSIDLHRM